MNRRMWAALAALATLATVGSSLTALAGPAGLAPHRAVYSMGLASTKSGSGIAGASGTMTYAFDDVCDGWVVENRIAITYTYTEGGQVASVTDFITWESKDGLKYRFRMRNIRDGQVTEDVQGSAELKGKGREGYAKFLSPEPMVVPLPKGTLFPTEHTQRLISAAQTGNPSLFRVVFDGSGLDGPFEVNAMIGRQSQTFPATGGDPLVAGPVWPMRLAFFALDGTEAAPEFEMAVDYHSNGVSGEIIQSFKNFSLRGHLEQVESLPRRKC